MGQILKDIAAPRKRTSKGEIKVCNDNGRIRLRWSVPNIGRFSYNTGFSYTAENLIFAEVKALEIKLDILKGTFAPHLYKGRTAAKKKKKELFVIPAFVAASEEQKLLPENIIAQEPLTTFFEHPPTAEPQDNNSLSAIIPEILQPVTTEIYLHQLAESFTRWAKIIRNKNVDQDEKFKALKNKLLKWKNIPLDQFPDQLADERLNPVTGNEYLSLYKDFCKWLLKHKKISVNPLEDVNRVRVITTLTPEKRKPLTTAELKSIFAAIKNNVYGRHHSHYFPWISFVFLTGARNSEAVGLRVGNVDFKNRKITICEALARGKTGGTHSKARIRKDTKGQNSRDLPMCKTLEKILLPLCKGKDADDLVFQSPNGLAINDAQVRIRVWKQVLIGLKISYHVIYCARKTFADRAIDAGYTIKQLAYYFGHKRTSTTMRYYIEVLTTDVPLPNKAFK